MNGRRERVEAAIVFSAAHHGNSANNQVTGIASRLPSNLEILRSLSEAYSYTHTPANILQVIHFSGLLFPPLLVLNTP